jgi:hypothetical protein
MLTLYLPKWGASEFGQNISRIGTDLEDVFSGKDRPIYDPTASTTQDDYVEIIRTPNAPAQTLVTAVPPRVRSLPAAATLPRPDILFGSTLPYTLIVRNRSDGIDIDCSHAPTLNLIYEYFNNHTRKNMIDHRKVSKMAFYRAPFLTRLSLHTSESSWFNHIGEPALSTIGSCLSAKTIELHLGS